MNQHSQTMLSETCSWGGPHKQIIADCLFFDVFCQLKLSKTRFCPLGWFWDVGRLPFMLRFYAAKIRGLFMVEWQDRTDQQSYNGPQRLLCDPKLQDLDKVATSLAKWRAMTTTTSLCQDSHDVVVILRTYIFVCGEALWTTGLDNFPIPYMLHVWNIYTYIRRIWPFADATSRSPRFLSTWLREALSSCEFCRRLRAELRVVFY